MYIREDVYEDDELDLMDYMSEGSDDPIFDGSAVSYDEF